MLRYSWLSSEQSSVFVTASTGKAAIGINGTTLPFIFRLPFKTPDKLFEYVEPKDEVLHELRHRYKYLKFLPIYKTSTYFSHQNLVSKITMNNSFLFGGISVMAIRDFLQIPPNKLQGVYINARKGCQQALNSSL